MVFSKNRIENVRKNFADKKRNKNISHAMRKRLSRSKEMSWKCRGLSYKVKNAAIKNKILDAFFKLAAE